MGFIPSFPEFQQVEVVGDCFLAVNGSFEPKFDSVSVSEVSDGCARHEER